MPTFSPPTHPTLPRSLKSIATLFDAEGRVRPATTTRCLSCGRPLLHPEIADHTSQTAPWFCTVERIGFWNVELCAEARGMYRAHCRDFGYADAWLREAVKRERGS